MIKMIKPKLEDLIRRFQKELEIETKAIEDEMFEYFQKEGYTKEEYQNCLEQFYKELLKKDFAILNSNHFEIYQSRSYKHATKLEPSDTFAIYPLWNLASSFRAGKVVKGISTFGFFVRMARKYRFSDEETAQMCIAIMAVSPLNSYDCNIKIKKSFYLEMKNIVKATFNLDGTLNPEVNMLYINEYFITKNLSQKIMDIIINELYQINAKAYQGSTYETVINEIMANICLKDRSSSDSEIDSTNLTDFPEFEEVRNEVEVNFDVETFNLDKTLEDADKALSEIEAKTKANESIPSELKAEFNRCSHSFLLYEIYFQSGLFSNKSYTIKQLTAYLEDHDLGLTDEQKEEAIAIAKKKTVEKAKANGEINFAFSKRTFKELISDFKNKLEAELKQIEDFGFELTNELNSHKYNKWMQENAKGARSRLKENSEDCIGLYTKAKIWFEKYHCNEDSKLQNFKDITVLLGGSVTIRLLLNSFNNDCKIINSFSDFKYLQYMLKKYRYSDEEIIQILMAYIYHDSSISKYSNNAPLNDSLRGCHQLLNEDGNIKDFLNSIDLLLILYIKKVDDNLIRIIINNLNNFIKQATEKHLISKCDAILIATIMALINDVQAIKVSYDAKITSHEEKNEIKRLYDEAKYDFNTYDLDSELKIIKELSESYDKNSSEARIEFGYKMQVFLVHVFNIQERISVRHDSVIETIAFLSESYQIGSEEERRAFINELKANYYQPDVSNKSSHDDQRVQMEEQAALIRAKIAAAEREKEEQKKAALNKLKLFTNDSSTITSKEEMITLINTAGISDAKATKYLELFVEDNVILEEKNIVQITLEKINSIISKANADLSIVLCEGKRDVPKIVTQTNLVKLYTSYPHIYRAARDICDTHYPAYEKIGDNLKITIESLSMACIQNEQINKDALKVQPLDWQRLVIIYLFNYLLANIENNIADDELLPFIEEYMRLLNDLIAEFISLPMPKDENKPELLF